jgi:hypothetical protein
MSKGDVDVRTLLSSARTARERAERPVAGAVPRGRAATVAVLAALACLAMMAIGAGTASAEVKTFTATETLPVPPASNFHGTGGGDGWSVALSNEDVYNVFHHQEYLGVACHVQSTSEWCWGESRHFDTITETGTNAPFATGSQPGMYLDRHSGKLYVYATRMTDDTGGVVCVDTTENSNPDPFCGFTPLTGTGEATRPSGDSAISDPMLIGEHWYAFNFGESKGQEGDENKLMCFDVATDAPCEGQPYAVGLPNGTMDTGSGFPDPADAAIDGKAFIPANVEGKELLACFEDSTQSPCAGKSWPASMGGVADYGAPFPLMDETGTVTGVCAPTGTDPCVNLEGESTPTPTHMQEVVFGGAGWNGPAFVLGPRVYLPNFDTNNVECFDYSTGSSCKGFPKHLEGLDLLYTVNADPQRPTCIWVNSDNGSDQIQNFDAYTGEACGGAIRVLASQFVVPKPQCTPLSYVSLQVLKPQRSVYGEGHVAFDNGDGEPIPGLNELALDGTGTANLEGLELNTPTGLPQFLFTLENLTEPVGEVEVQLTWKGNYEAVCLGEETKVEETKVETPKQEEKKPTPAPAPESKPTPKGEVAAFGSAHIASSARACYASDRAPISVTGSLISSVTFTVNGRKLATVTKPSHGRYTASVKVSPGHREKVVIHVTYSAQSKTHTATITRTVARCAAHHTAPRFTG